LSAYYREAFFLAAGGTSRAIETVFAFLTPVAVIVAAYFKHGRLHEIHILVNSKMARALNEIAELKAKIAVLSPSDESAADAKQANADAVSFGRHG